MTADLLVEILRDAEFDERARVARRLASLIEIPDCLVRLILRDEIEIAQPLLARTAVAERRRPARLRPQRHRRPPPADRARRGVSEVVAEALVERGRDAGGRGAAAQRARRVSRRRAVEMVVAMTQQQPQIVPLLLRRPELRPNHAYVLFWWADADAPPARSSSASPSRARCCRRRPATSSRWPPTENWQDGLSRKALQFIERRQRNRAAIEKSPYASLEDAVAAARAGPDPRDRRGDRLSRRASSR